MMIKEQWRKKGDPNLQIRFNPEDFTESAMTILEGISKEYFEDRNSIKFILKANQVFSSAAHAQYSFHEFKNVRGLDFLFKAQEIILNLAVDNIDQYLETHSSKVFSKLAKRYVISSTTGNGLLKNPEELEETLCNFEELIELISKVYNYLKNNFDYQKTPFNSEIRSSIAELLSALGDIKFLSMKLRREDESTKVAKYFYSSMNVYPLSGTSFYLASNCALFTSDTFETSCMLLLSYLNIHSKDCRKELNHILNATDAEYNRFKVAEKRTKFNDPLLMFKFYSLALLHVLNSIISGKNRGSIKRDLVVAFQALNALLKKITQNPTQLSPIYKIINHSLIIVVATIYLAELDNEEIPNTLDEIRVCCLEDVVVGAAEIFAAWLSNMKRHLQEPSHKFFGMEIIKFIISRKYILQCLNSTLECSNIVTKIKGNVPCSFTQDHIDAGERKLLGFRPFEIQYTPITSLKLIDTKQSLPIYQVYMINQLSENLEQYESTGNAKHKNKIKFSDYENEDLEEIEEGLQFINFSNITPGMSDISKVPIVIDGCNVAIRYGAVTFKTEGIIRCIEYWQRKGNKAIVILPDYCFSIEEINRRREKSISLSKSKTLPDDVLTLIDLQKKGVAFGVPNKDYDDSYMLQYAKEVGGYIISNDRFADHIGKYSNRSGSAKDEVRKWVKTHVISYAFIGENFIPNPDFMKSNKMDH